MASAAIVHLSDGVEAVTGRVVRAERVPVPAEPEGNPMPSLDPRTPPEPRPRTGASSRPASFALCFEGRGERLRESRLFDLRRDERVLRDFWLDLDLDLRLSRDPRERL